MEGPPASQYTAADRSDDTDARLAMISEWMANGNINDFVKAHPGVERLELVGFSFNLSLSSLQVR